VTVEDLDIAVHFVKKEVSILSKDAKSQARPIQKLVEHDDRFELIGVFSNPRRSTTRSAASH
jgi:hypothetical protein